MCMVMCCDKLGNKSELLTEFTKDDVTLYICLVVLCRCDVSVYVPTTLLPIVNDSYHVIHLGAVTTKILHIGIGAGLAGLVLAGPLFR